MENREKLEERTRDPEPSRGRLEQTLEKDKTEPKEETRDPEPSRRRPEQTLKKDLSEPEEEIQVT